MSMPTFVHVEPRKVKHARLRVSEGGEVRLIVPIGFTQHQVESLYARKSRWVDKQRSYFNERAHRSNLLPSLGAHSILLHGEPYGFSYNRAVGSRIRVNHESKIVESGLLLSDADAVRKWYRKYASKALHDRVAHLASERKIPFRGRVYVRDSLTKWGNCSGKGNISLNWRLILVPPSARDYVVLHELLHIQIPNHSKAFWSRMRGLMPSYRETARLLDGYTAATDEAILP